MSKYLDTVNLKKEKQNVVGTSPDDVIKNGKLSRFWSNLSNGDNLNDRSSPVFKNKNKRVHYIAADKREYPQDIFSYFSMKILGSVGV